MLGEREEAVREVWRIPTPEPTTGWQFVRAVFEEVGNPPKIGAVSSTLVKTLGLFWPLTREGAETVYQFEKPFVGDGGKYRRAFGGYEATPYREGIRQTIDWYRQGSVKAKLAGNGTRKRQVPRRSCREQAMKKIGEQRPEDAGEGDQ